MKTLSLSAALLGLLALAAGPDDAAGIAAQKPCYPLTTCPISGEELGSGGMQAIDLVHEGKLVTLCCKGCAKEFQKAPAAVVAKIDAAVVAAQQADYPLATCPVDGQAVGENPQRVVVGMKLVELCSAACEAELAKAPDAALAKVDAAWIEAQLSTYPTDVCLVTDEELGGRPVRVLHGLTLVQLCCKDCAKEFKQDPAPVLAKLAAARKAAPAKPAPAPPADGQ